MVSQASHLGNELEPLPKAKPKDPSTCCRLEVDRQQHTCIRVCVHAERRLKHLCNNLHIYSCLFFSFVFVNYTSFLDHSIPLLGDENNQAYL